ncbi:MAG: cytochrome c3 family protein [bacterium JZ-2024 1]
MRKVGILFWRFLPGCVVGMLMLSAAVPEKGATNTCLECHENLEKEAGVEGPAHQWPTSIHKEYGVSCDSCHGGDPANSDAMEAMNPERGFIGAPEKGEVPDFCGRCHINVALHFKQSRHWTTELPEKPHCVTCHTAHQQKKVTVELISPELCGNCHSFEQAERIKKALFVTDARLISIEDRMRKMKYLGFDVRDLEQSHFALRNVYHTLFHELSLPVVQDVTINISADLEKMESILSGYEHQERNRRIFGYTLMGLFVLAAVSARIYRKSLPV